MSMATNKLYSIGQVHAITGIPKPTLRFWEKEFASYLKPYRTQGNQRRYNDSSVQLIERIDRLVHREGYTLDGARKKLAAEEAAKEAAEVAMPGLDETRVNELAETMSDYILQKLFARSQSSEAS